jgi:hypothetical protein
LAITADIVEFINDGISVVEVVFTVSITMATSGPVASLTIQLPSNHTTAIYDTVDMPIAINVPNGMSF